MYNGLFPVISTLLFHNNSIKIKKMKKIKILFFLCAIGISIISCDEDITGGSISACNYSKSEKVSFSTAIKLKVAANRMSSAYYNTSGIYSANFFSDLKTPLAKGNTGQTYRGQVEIKLASHGNCTGNNKETIPGRDSRIGGNYITMKVPSATSFVGEATTSIRSDDWKSKYSSSNNQYILWVGTDNDPQYNGLNGNINGAVIEYNPSAGKIVLQGKGSNKYYIQNGVKVYL